MYLVTYLVLTAAYIFVLFHLARRAAEGDPAATRLGPRSGMAKAAALAPAE